MTDGISGKHLLFCPLQVSLSSLRTLKHGKPIPVIRRQPEQPVQPNIVQYQAILLAVKHTHSTSHLLQVFRKRQCRPRQLYELHIGTIKAFTEQVNIHQGLNALHCHVCPIRPVRLIFQDNTLFKPSNKHLSLIRRCLRTNHHGIDSMLPIVFRNMLRMLNIYGIHNPLLVPCIPQHSITKSFDTRSHIQLLTHLPQREIPVRSSLLQRVYHTPLLAISPHRHIVIQRQPSLGNKPVMRPRLQQDIKQVRKPMLIQPARSSRQSQELRSLPLLPHHFIGLGKGMMRLINND